ncbi:hypothetical protein E8D34_05085 [Nocardioides sp. GY 10113]|uniref:DUF2231 domain-containing protein n=1 Tax=Nocardioides sp. GY 10113 TaxID=2569761 RepID=UPI0010A93545|nr:DUF2231 domain-containing protein [Nocardioides sp. GY 10113]TIC88312.1 hypothetical protein E8D34_05085 [Nocardioides sp. GY 10113]
MFDLVNGLPLHPLVVHAVVVLLPLACLGTIAIAVSSRLRRRYGLLVVACAALATALIPIATSSGEALEEHVGNPGEHAELGDQLIWFAIPLLVLGAALVWLDRRRPDSSAPDAGEVTREVTRADSASSALDRPVALRAVGVLALVAALATSVQVYRVGDSGARAAWGDQVASSAN